MSIDICIQYTRNLDEKKDNLRVQNNQRKVRDATCKASVSVGLIGAIAIATATNAHAVDFINVTNSNVTSEAAQRAANAVACGAVGTTCAQKITDPKAKIALISCGIALGWCGKYLLTGK